MATMATATAPAWGMRRYRPTAARHDQVSHTAVNATLSTAARGSTSSAQPKMRPLSSHENCSSTM